ncbi:MAG: sigma-70 family RNA polymerase sigma factor [Planctomycetaceae bacterium]|jgi:RNA polymerase sigma-70 factor (ECF subfamily)|nr:sigma-70 family RNA polymerase sigma factor [Planctomycetaceae bacterium]
MTTREPTHPNDDRTGQPELDVGTLATLVYDELRGLAGAYMRDQRAGHTLQPTALVNEAFLKIAKANPRATTSRSHFLAVAATAMRQVLINHAEARGARKRGGGRVRVDLDQHLSPERGGLSLLEVLAIDDVLRKLAELDGRKASVIEMKLFGNLTHEEIAEVLGVSLSTVEADWRMARAWLAKELAEGTA